MKRSFRNCLSTFSTFSTVSSLLACACLFPSCIPTWAQQKAVDQSAAGRDTGTATTAPAENSPALVHRDNRYRLCASDVIAVNFPLTPEFDQTLTIQPDGFATLSAVGAVRLEGLTTDESIRAIGAAYSKTLHDSGSTLLGFCLAFLTLDFYRSSPASLPVALFPVFVAALPLLDAALAIIRRFRHRQSLLRGDRLHLYDVMLVRGSSPRKVALVFFALTGFLAGLGWLVLLTKRTTFILSDVAALAALLCAAVRLGALGRPQNCVPRELAPTGAVSSRPSR